MKPKQISALEQDVMNIVWELGSCTVRDVLDRFSHTKQLAYTTIMTVMGRLIEKRVLTRKLAGRSYLYQPKVSKESFVAKSVHTIFIAAVSSLGQEAVTHFVKEIRKLSPKKRKELLEVLDE